MSQRITNARLLDENGNVEHDNVNGYVVFLKDANNVETWGLVFEKQAEKLEPVANTESKMNLGYSSLKSDDPIVGNPDTDKFKLASVSYNGDLQNNATLVWTYVTYEKNEKDKKKNQEVNT